MCWGKIPPCVQVYEPAEDSFLMLDALELELEKLKRLVAKIYLNVCNKKDFRPLSSVLRLVEALES